MKLFTRLTKNALLQKRCSQNEILEFLLQGVPLSPLFFVLVVVVFKSSQLYLGGLLFLLSYPCCYTLFYFTRHLVQTHTLNVYLFSTLAAKTL